VIIDRLKVALSDWHKIGVSKQFKDGASDSLKAGVSARIVTYMSDWLIPGFSE